MKTNLISLESRDSVRLFLVILFCAISISSYGEQSVTLAWDPNPETDLAGYIIYYGSANRNYTNAVNVGNITTNTVSGLVDGVTYYFAVTAYNTNGLESNFSNEVSYSRPTGSPIAITLQPLITRSNVTLRGTSSVAGMAAWFDLSEGTNAPNWHQVPALGPTNQIYWVSLSTNQMASYGGSKPTNWTYRFSTSDTSNQLISASVSFDLRVPTPKRLRIIMTVFQSASLGGPWTEALSYTVTNEMTSPPMLYRSHYSLQILPDEVP